MRVAIAGGTGVVGRLTVEAVRGNGHEAVVLARSTGVELVSGNGLAEALAGADAVIDVSNIAATRASVVSEFFEATSRNLMRASAQAGVRHIVTLSIIGVDRVPFGYYQGKLRQEKVLAESRVPVSILRAAQFHEFPGQYLARSSRRFVVVPRWRTQPVAAREVATALAALAAGSPVPVSPTLVSPILVSPTPVSPTPVSELAGPTPVSELAGPTLVSELAGPREENMADLLRQVLAARGERRRVVELRVPGAAGKAMATGRGLPGPGARLGTQAFAEWLSRRTGRQRRQGGQGHPGRQGHPGGQGHPGKHHHPRGQGRPASPLLVTVGGERLRTAGRGCRSRLSPAPRRPTWLARRACPGSAVIRRRR